MSGRNGKGRIHTPGFCTHDAAESLAHSAYLLARKEVAEEMRKMALGFEERIKALESRLVALEPQAQNAALTD